MSGASSYYYVPEYSKWPIITSVGVFLTLVGAINLLHSNTTFGMVSFIAGALVMAYILFGWFGAVVNESRSGYYNAMMDRSFRWGMFWFIFSEVMFFSAFFGALFYARHFSVPWLGGAGHGALTNQLLWPDFHAVWPLMNNPDQALFVGPKHIIPIWGIPALNTILLLSSACTLTWAHWALKYDKRSQVIFGLFFTVLLGCIFLGCQCYEYVLAHTHDGLTLSSGIYGSTFFMLTGFHGAHVTVGTIMLISILVRVIKGHFNADDHFGFEACAWYWHFVDVVWLFLFIFVYWL